MIYAGLSLTHGSKAFKLKGEIIKNGFSEMDRQFLGNLRAFLDEYGIRMVETPNDIEAVLDAMAEYLLLPSNALIVASCRHHMIKCIATFDGDFKRLRGLNPRGGRRIKHSCKVKPTFRTFSSSRSNIRILVPATTESLSASCSDSYWFL